jgi:hypothetical protein
MADERLTNGNPDLTKFHGQRNEEGDLCGIPPVEIQQIIKRLSASSTLVNIGESERQEVSSIPAEQLSEGERQLLDSFAATLAGVQECRIRAIYGCASCTLGCTGGHGEPICHRGNRVITDCGRQCWYCCID